MGHSEHGFQGFYPISRLYAIIVIQDFQNYLDHILPNSESIFALSLQIFSRTQFHSIETGSHSFSGFLNTSLVFLIFSLCAK